MTQPLLFNPKSTPMSPFFDSAGIQSDVLSLSDSSTGSFEDGPFLNFNDSPPDTPTSVQPSLVSSLPSTSSPTVSSQTNQGSTEGVSLDMLIPWLVLDEEGNRQTWLSSLFSPLLIDTTLKQQESVGHFRFHAHTICFSQHQTFSHSSTSSIRTLIPFQRTSVKGAPPISLPNLLLNSLLILNKRRIKDIVCHLVICTPKQQFTTSLLKEILEFCERLFPGRDERDNINQVKLCIIRVSARALSDLFCKTTLLPHICAFQKHGSSRIVYFRKRFNQVAPKHPLRFLEYSSEEIAQQLTLIEFSAFKFIEVRSNSSISITGKRERLQNSPLPQTINRTQSSTVARGRRKTNIQSLLILFT